MDKSLELADFIDGNVSPFIDDHQEYLDKATAMLRQQQAEIEVLKLQLHTTLTNRDLRTYDGKLDMNNEPVVWMDPKELEDPELTSTAVSKHKMYPQDIPLYTHPTKTLTDDEIIEIWCVMETDTGKQNIDFARAILRKASE
jgi:hypothetical protein